MSNSQLTKPGEERKQITQIKFSMVLHIHVYMYSTSLGTAKIMYAHVHVHEFVPSLLIYMYMYLSGLVVRAPAICKLEISGSNPTQGSLVADCLE